MIRSFEWMIAARYLRARREDGFVSATATLSVIGVMLGVAVLIIVMSVMNGFQSTIIDQLVGLRGHILVYGNDRGGYIEDYETLTEKVKAIDGVVDARPMVEGQALAVGYNDTASFALVYGIRREDLFRHSLTEPDNQGHSKIIEGSLDDFVEGDSIVLGARLAETLRVAVGDVVQLVSPQTTDTAFGSVPRMRDYQVVAIFSVGNVSFDSTTIYMPLSDAQIYFRHKGMATVVEAIVEDPKRVMTVQARIRDEIKPTPPTQNWMEINSSWVGALQVERNVMFVILVLIILVAAFNITSSLIMLVKNKGRDIAVLRTMGASRQSIMRIFVICGGVMGVVGCLSGLILGLVLLEFRHPILLFFGSVFGVQFFPPEVYGIDGLPADIQFLEVTLIMLIALALSLLMTIYPSRRAANLHPVEALRYE